MPALQSGVLAYDGVSATQAFNYYYYDDDMDEDEVKQVRRLSLVWRSGLDGNDRLMTHAVMPQQAAAACTRRPHRCCNAFPPCLQAVQSSLMEALLSAAGVDTRTAAAAAAASVGAGLQAGVRAAMAATAAAAVRRPDEKSDRELPATPSFQKCAYLHDHHACRHRPCHAQRPG